MFRWLLHSSKMAVANCYNRSIRKITFWIPQKILEMLPLLPTKMPYTSYNHNILEDQVQISSIRCKRIKI